MKICHICKQNKELSYFHKNASRKDGLQTFCKICAGNRSKERYANNAANVKQKAKQKAKERRDKTRRFVWDYLNKSKCIDCGESNPVVLEFDHVRGEKKDTISMMTSYGSIKLVSEEIAKCEIRCANCHRIKTAIQLKWYKDLIT